jgi:anti-sigma factor RsiW
MKCDQVYLHICDSLDEDLASPRCREIREHLEHCPECQAYLRSLKTTIALYRAMPEPKLPAEAHRNLFKTITSLTAEAERACTTPKRRQQRRTVHAVNGTLRVNNNKRTGKP